MRALGPVARLGRRPAARQLWAGHQPATPVGRAVLGLGEGASVHAFHRVRTVDGVPFALETTYMPAELTPGILDEPEQGSLWAALRSRYGIELARSTAVLESIVLDDPTSVQLGVRAGSAGTPPPRRTEAGTGPGEAYPPPIHICPRQLSSPCRTL